MFQRHRSVKSQFLGLLALASTWGAASEAEPKNEAVRAVIDAARSGQHPERLSPLVTPATFDAAVYRRDPAAYCRVVEPGRVFQSATPGSEVPQLLPASPTGVTIPALGSTPLCVTTVPGAPVTFTSEGGGAFANGLTSITVPADDAGRAEVAFTATEGTFAIATILAGSPLAAGQVSFAITIEER